MEFPHYAAMFIISWSLGSAWDVEIIGKLLAVS